MSLPRKPGIARVGARQACKVGVSGAGVRVFRRADSDAAGGGKGLGARMAAGGVGVKTHLDGALGLNGGAIGGGGGEGEVGLAAQLGGKLVLDLARVAGERDLAHEVPVLVAIVLRRNLSSE